MWGVILESNGDDFAGFFNQDASNTAIPYRHSFEVGQSKLVPAIGTVAVKRRGYVGHGHTRDIER